MIIIEAEEVSIFHIPWGFVVRLYYTLLQKTHCRPQTPTPQAKSHLGGAPPVFPGSESRELGTAACGGTGAGAHGREAEFF